MKTQILIEDGAAQVVLTPETDFETAALQGLKNGEHLVAIRRGEFALTRGGFFREFDHKPRVESVMLVADLRPKEVAGPNEVVEVEA